MYLPEHFLWRVLFYWRKAMIKYTTPTITLVVEGVDLTGKNIYATLEQGCRELTKKGSEMTVTTETVGERTDTVLTMVLSQEESASFDFNRNVYIQVNWIASNGVRAATEIKAILVMKNLLDEVISYGD